MSHVLAKIPPRKDLECVENWPEGHQTDGGMFLVEKHSFGVMVHCDADIVVMRSEHGVHIIIDDEQ